MSTEVQARASTHGTYRGFQRHRRLNEQACDLCRAARNGYDQAVKAGRRERASPTAPALPDELTEALLRLCRAIVLGRPVGRIRELATAALRAEADKRAAAGPPMT